MANIRTCTSGRERWVYILFLFLFLLVCMLELILVWECCFENKIRLVTETFVDSFTIDTNSHLRSIRCGWIRVSTPPVCMERLRRTVDQHILPICRCSCCQLESHTLPRDRPTLWAWWWRGDGCWPRPTAWGQLLFSFSSFSFLS